jgi:hypothetical protein
VAITLTELQTKLMLIDETSLMEILEITSEDLANRFIDRIETKYDQLITEFEDMEDHAYREGDEWWEFQDTQDELYTDEDEQ